MLFLAPFCSLLASCRASQLVTVRKEGRKREIFFPSTFAAAEKREKRERKIDSPTGRRKTGVFRPWPWIPSRARPYVPEPQGTTRAVPGRDKRNRRGPEERQRKVSGSSGSRTTPTGAGQMGDWSEPGGRRTRARPGRGRKKRGQRPGERVFSQAEVFVDEFSPLF